MSVLRVIFIESVTFGLSLETATWKVSWKGVLKKFARFIEKQQRWSFFYKQIAGLRLRSKNSKNYQYVLQIKCRSNAQKKT